MITKNYYEIDSKGKPVELYSLNDGDIIPDNFKEYSLSLFTPRWDFKRSMWVEDENISEKLILAKQAKKEELSLACEEHILKGFDYEIKGIEYHFSYDREAQLNMQETFQMFQNDMIKTIMWTVKLNNEHTRITLDRPMFNLVYTASLQHKQNAISRLRDKLIPILNQATTLEAVNVIRWDVLVVEPSPEPVIFNSENLVDKQIEEVKTTTQNLSQTVDLNGMAMIELMNLIFTGGI